MPFVVRNQTSRQQTFLLSGGNAVTLMPQGSSDITGPTDRGTLLDGEQLVDDVVNGVRTGLITVTPILTEGVRSPADIRPSEPEASRPPTHQQPEKKARSRW